MKKPSNPDEIVIGVNKETILVTNILAAILVVVQSDFFQKPLTDGEVLLALGLWLWLMLATMSKISISKQGIKVYVLFVRIKAIDPKRIDRIEIVRWNDTLHVVFEFDKCPKYDGGSILSLKNYLFIHFFRTIDYSVLDQQEEYALNLVESLFGEKEIIDHREKNKA